MVNLKPYQVYKHFKVNKIKRKTIQEVYPNQNRRYLRNNDRFLEVQEELMDAHMRNFRIIYIDQCHHTNRSDLKLEYSNKYTNIQIVKSQSLIQPQFVNMAVSRENGLEAYLIYNSPLTSKTFIEIFDELDKKGKQWKLFGDNTSW